jgi:hypothetical protein
MESPTVVVPTTQTYYHRETGVGYRLTAGDVITQRRAYLLQVGTASDPAAGGVGATIRNFFPDGAISSAALIDLEEGQDFDEHVWTGYRGTETLSRVATYAGFASRFDALKVEVPGDSLAEGLQGADWTNRYGCEVPAGRYRVGFTISTGAMPLFAYPFGWQDGEDIGEFSAQQIAILPNWRQRFVLDIAVPVACMIGLGIITTDQIAVNGSSPTATADAFYVGQVMVTEGDPLVFADGGSAGWAWSGTAHASASYGPQP